ncbi:acyl-CoA dehydrogenase family protein [Nocardiopsis changdeensis]|uniref:acyl-CoA dehydrogenase family protein n=1 Tax=Nocardiopsis changdeensis TaxID=2831969 RepID=UPI003F449277
MLTLSTVDDGTARLGALRSRVRGFLRAQIRAGAFTPAPDAWMSSTDPAFSQRLAGQGWVGMTIPVEYGGHGRDPLERHVVTEELLAAGAPVAAHWIADRQMAPAILRDGTEEQKRAYLPGIAGGERYFGIGMSEPDSGSDLASVRTRAAETPQGWRITGTKVWTSTAHTATNLVVLARTDEAEGDRHRGLSQFIVDLPHPDIHIRPIITIDGEHHFNEVVFDGATVPAASLLGTRGQGWRQVTSELANERSGPERILSMLPLLTVWAAGLDRDDPVARVELGRLVSRLAVLRGLSFAVAEALRQGRDPAVEAALVKDLGTAFEGDVVDTVRRTAELEPDLGGAGPESMLARAVLHTPALTLRGGTSEILRSIVAKGLTR